MNGILLIDKPSDWTSNDVVIKLKGMLHCRRVGHSGTLDPMATGLLVVFVGRATRAVQFAEAQSKRYVASLRPGLRTDTLDTTGQVLESRELSLAEADIQAVLPRFRGDIKQIPPMYSALKVKGQKLYDIARKGGEVERKPRDISIHSLELTGRDGDDFVLDIACSKGTYIRSLCADIGEALGCGACMSALRRVSAGDFSVDRAYSLAQVQQAVDEGRVEGLMLPVDSLFASCPAYTANAREEKRIRCGNELGCTLPDGDYRVYAPGGEFLMLGRAERGILKTVKSFFDPEG